MILILSEQGIRLPGGAVAAIHSRIKVLILGLLVENSAATWREKLNNRRIRVTSKFYNPYTTVLRGSRKKYPVLNGTLSRHATCEMHNCTQRGYPSSDSSAP